MDFFERIEEIAKSKGTCLCIGLDPYFEREERAKRGDEACLDQALKANLRIIETTHPFTACYKPNVAFYEAFGAAGLEVLRKTLDAIPQAIPFILDAKRGDIDSTAKAYADSLFGLWGADAVTLSAYMGKDSVDPFLAWKDKGVFVLCKTSNPGAGAFQNLEVDGETLYIRVARETSSWSNRVGLVVAGNSPEALARVRTVAPHAWFLAPGIGAQGGKADLAMRSGARSDGSGILVVAARSVAGAADPGEAARVLRDTMRSAMEGSLESVTPVTGWTSAPAAIPSLGSEALKDELVRHLIATGCFKLGEFVLKSGKRSPFYIDLRKLISDPEALRIAGKAYARLAGACTFDRLAGIPAAALPLATAAGLALSVPMIWPRMPVKEHGTGNKVEGEFKAGDRALLLDDLITTGASKLEAIEILRKEGLIVEDLIVLIERGKQGRVDMEKAGIKLRAFLHVKELFASCERLGIIDAKLRAELERFVDEE
ncbi:MAG: orotate phosphoribosyltransferase [Spirochaetae bacterium HGW-Spirochaetae-9]|nr:MAG: orotate phosphoribosyltransferase [Spirochaetae bacterium HGW-Spirochaetae-9]